MQVASIVTQCPECSTRFRVTPGQLKIAHGQVRCGHCLHVFSAVEYEEHTSSPRRHQAETKPTPVDRKIKPKPVSNTAHKHTQAKSIVKIQPPAVAVDVEKSEASSSDEKSPIIKTVVSHEQSPLAIQAEPVTLTKSIPKTNVSWGWLFALLLALTTLAGQFFWFNRAELYWNTALTPGYDALCSHLKCDLPLRHDIDQISNQQMTIRPHPSIENAILMDLILINQASFPQPYPLLQIQFSDLKGRHVTGRTLRPSDYLAEELASIDKMPVNRPVQITVELMSPGPRGVNYSLELLASQP